MILYNFNNIKEVDVVVTKKMEEQKSEHQTSNTAPIQVAITEADDGNGLDLTADKVSTTEIGEGDDAQNVINDEPSTSTQNSARARVVADVSRTFAKVEKSLASIGFFTPS